MPSRTRVGVDWNPQERAYIFYGNGGKPLFRINNDGNVYQYLNGSSTPTLIYGSSGPGDMAKSVYDPNEDGVIAAAQLDTAVETTTGAANKVGSHAGLQANVHGVATLIGFADLVAHGSLRNAHGVATLAAVSDIATYVDTKAIKVASGDLSSGVANAFALAWQNPESSAIFVLEVMVDVTTAGGTANSVLDVGSSAAATTHSSNLMDGDVDGVDLNTTEIYITTKRVKLDANGGTTDYITGQILDANASSLAGKYYIFYVFV